MNEIVLLTIYEIYANLLSDKSFVVRVVFVVLIILFFYVNLVHNSKSSDRRTKTPPKSVDSKLAHYREAEFLEKSVYDLISANFPNYINCVNILLEKNNYMTQIDNLLITDKAVYCIECKNYVGSIGMYEYSQNWYQNLSTGSYEIYNPIKQNSSHINFLTNNLKDIHVLPIINLIVFSDECTLKNENIKKEYVHVIYRNELINIVKSYEMILKNKINYDTLMRIKNQLIELDCFSPNKLQQHIEGIKHRNNLND